MATSSSAFTGIHYTAFIIINRLLNFGNLMNKFLTFYVVFKKFHDFVLPVKNCFELDPTDMCVSCLGMTFVKCEMYSNSFIGSVSDPVFF